MFPFCGGSAQMFNRDNMLRKILKLLKGESREAHAGNSQSASEYSDEEIEAWHDEKSRRMEKVLGTEHDMVMHAIIPYAVGGGLDLYYYPNSVAGTGIATKELVEVPGQGSSNAVFNTYELVMFTKHSLDLDAAKNDSTPFGKAHQNINSVLNIFAPYSAQATLNPNETSEFPEEMEQVGGKCFILDAYNSDAADGEFGMMVVIEIHRSEMEFAREEGGGSLIERLVEAGHYPYSDLDRDPVV